MRAKVDKHRGKCNVCKHEDTREIEEHYFRGTPVAQIATLFELDLSSLWRHIRYYSLSDERLSRYVDHADQAAALASFSLEDDLRALDPKDRLAFYLKAQAQAAKWGGIDIERTADVSADLQQASDAELEFIATHGRQPTVEELEALRNPEPPDVVLNVH